jgi:membrane glycosyltransferase
VRFFLTLFALFGVTMSDIDKDELIKGLRQDLEKLVQELDCKPTTEVNNVSNERCDRMRKIIRDAFQSTIQTYRLYFIIRSASISILGALPFFLVVLLLGSINVIQTILLGIFVFVFSLIVTRLFEKAIVKLAQKIIIVLQRHKRVRDFILKNI